MSDFNEFTVGKQRTHDGETRPTINLTVTVNIDRDAPPSLVNVVLQAVGALIAVGLDEETCAQIRDDLYAIRDRKQREADNIARQLIGDEMPPE